MLTRLLNRLFGPCRPKVKNLGEAEAINNRFPRPGAAGHYIRVAILFRGSPRYLLLTPYEFAEASMRAVNNREDCPPFL